MSVQLTSVTQRPIEGSVYRFGGDDTQSGRSGLFGTIAQWDIEAKDDCFKTNFVFVFKRAFAFLDMIGVGTFFYGPSGLDGQVKNCERFQTGPGRNAQAREKIIAALGGAEVCSRIPTTSIAANADELPTSLLLGDQHFRGGQWVVQGEDVAGRKFVAMRLADRSGRIHIATAHQRFRETFIGYSDLYSNGSSWMLNFYANAHPSIDSNTDQVAEFINKVRTLQHEQFSIAIKP